MGRNHSRVELRRALGRPALTIYGVGGMLGGGIYAMVGAVAGEAGSWAWVAFLLAMLVAAPTALAYAELAARHPKAGGVASFARAAWGGRKVPFVLGWLVLFSGLVSMSALARAFAGYLEELLPNAQVGLVMFAFLAGLALVNLRGIEFASLANIVCTVIEASGLVIVIVVGATFLTGEAPEPVRVVEAAPISVAAFATGAGLAFYAFLGFEDMINVAEEVHEPERAYPFAIPLALAVVGTVYAGVAFVSTAVLSPSELAASTAPLTDVVARAAPSLPQHVYSAIALFAVANTALLNYVMASRLAFGMAREGLLSKWLVAVHAKWQTPHRAILVLFVIALALALSGRLAFLAGTTSFLLLIVFFAMNLALIRMRRDAPDWTGFSTPRLIPYLGLVLSLGLAFFLPPSSIVASLGVAAVALLIVTFRPRAMAL